MSRDKEWVSSIMGKPAINFLVEAGVLPDQAATGWRPAAGQPFPMPNTNELVVFEDFFWHGFGLPAHPFLRDLIEYYGVSLCNLHPNTILHISIFINFCESCLGIQSHFSMFCHFFWLKKKGGAGSKIVGGVYLQLWDGMTSEYISIPLNTSVKHWNAKWFYVKQVIPQIRCDVDHIPKNNPNWSVKPSSEEMN